jgi:hypothetical protein
MIRKPAKRKAKVTPKKVKKAVSATGHAPGSTTLDLPPYVPPRPVAPIIARIHDDHVEVEVVDLHGLAWFGNLLKETFFGVKR